MLGIQTFWCCYKEVNKIVETPNYVVWPENQQFCITKKTAKATEKTTQEGQKKRKATEDDDNAFPTSLHFDVKDLESLNTSGGSTPFSALQTMLQAMAPPPTDALPSPLADGTTIAPPTPMRALPPPPPPAPETRDASTPKAAATKPAAAARRSPQKATPPKAPCSSRVVLNQVTALIHAWMTATKQA